MRTTHPDLDILARMESADSLPTPPAVLTQLNKIVNDPNMSAASVAAVMSEDPGMTGKILRMVNSAYYGLSDTVSSVRQAIIILGINAVQSLVLCAGAFEAFSVSDEDREFQDEFWRHSLRTAAAARVLCTLRSEENDRLVNGQIEAAEAFSTGLLHDIGKMVLLCHFPEERREVCAHPDFGRIADRRVEADVLGVDHAEIGGCLAERWNLPPALIAALRHHHDLIVENEEHLTLVRMIHVADFLAHVGAGARSQNPNFPDLDMEEAAAVGLSSENLADLVERARQEYGRSETFLQMVGG